MRPTHPRSARIAAAALAALAALAPTLASSAEPERPPVATVKVVGDSLSDSGTFAKVLKARIASVQGSADEPYVLWAERVAQAYGLAPLCPHYGLRISLLFGFTSHRGCTNFAVSGASVNNPVSAGGSDQPLSVLKQLSDLGAEPWQAQDLLLITGGGNDASNLATAYLGRSADQGVAYRDMLNTMLPGEMLAQVLAGEQGPETAGVLYMRTLADSMVTAIQTHALNRGAPRVLLVNMPNVTDTPRFQDTLRQLAASDGAVAAARVKVVL